MYSTQTSDTQISTVYNLDVRRDKIVEDDRNILNRVVTTSAQQQKIRFRESNNNEHESSASVYRSNNRVVNDQQEEVEGKPLEYCRAVRNLFQHINSHTAQQQGILEQHNSSTVAYHNHTNIQNTVYHQPATERHDVTVLQSHGIDEQLLLQEEQIKQQQQQILLLQQQLQQQRKVQQHLQQIKHQKPHQQEQHQQQQVLPLQENQLNQQSPQLQEQDLNLQYLQQQEQYDQNNQSEETMKTIKRRLSTGDVRKEEGKKNKNKKQNDEKEPNNNEEGMGTRAKSVDYGKKWFGKSPKLRKKKNSFDISDAELVFSTYSGSPEPLNTLQRKKKQELNDIIEKKDEIDNVHKQKVDLHNGNENLQNNNENNLRIENINLQNGNVNLQNGHIEVEKYDIITEVISNPVEVHDVESEDLHALRELLFDLEDTNDTGTPPNQMVAFINVPLPQTPTSTPQGNITPVSGQHDSSHQNGGIEEKVLQEQLRRSGLIDEELFEKLKAIERENINSSNNESDTSSLNKDSEEIIAVSQINEVHSANDDFENFIQMETDVKAVEKEKPKDTLPHVNVALSSPVNLPAVSGKCEQMVANKVETKENLQLSEEDITVNGFTASEIIIKINNNKDPNNNNITTNNNNNYNKDISGKEQFDSVGSIRLTSLHYSEEELERMEKTNVSSSPREKAVSECVDESSVDDEFVVIDTPVRKERPDDDIFHIEVEATEVKDDKRRADSLLLEIDEFTTESMPSTLPESASPITEGTAESGKPQSDTIPLLEYSKSTEERIANATKRITVATQRIEASVAPNIDVPTDVSIVEVHMTPEERIVHATERMTLATQRIEANLSPTIEKRIEDGKTDLSSNECKTDLSSNERKTDLSSNERKINLFSNESKIDLSSNERKIDLSSNERKTDLSSNERKTDLSSNGRKTDLSSNERKTDLVQITEPITTCDTVSEQNEINMTSVITPVESSEFKPIQLNIVPKRVRSELTYFIASVESHSSVRNLHIDGKKTVSLTVTNIEPSQNDNENITCDDHTEDGYVIVKSAGESTKSDNIVIIDNIEPTETYAVECEPDLSEYDNINDTKPDQVRKMRDMDKNRISVTVLLDQLEKNEDNAENYQTSTDDDDHPDVSIYAKELSANVIEESFQVIQQTTASFVVKPRKCLAGLSFDYDSVGPRVEAPHEHIDEQKVQAEKIDDVHAEKVIPEETEEDAKCQDVSTEVDIPVQLSVEHDKKPAEAMQNNGRTAYLSVSSDTSEFEVIQEPEYQTLPQANIIHEDVNIKMDSLVESIPVDNDFVNVTIEATVESVPENTLHVHVQDTRPKEILKSENDTVYDSEEDLNYVSACHDFNEEFGTDISKREKLIRKLLLKMAKTKYSLDKGDEEPPPAQQNIENDETDAAVIANVEEVEEVEYTYANPESKKVSELAMVILKQCRSLEIISEDEDDEQTTKKQEDDEETATKQAYKPMPGAIRVMLPAIIPKLKLNHNITIEKVESIPKPIPSARPVKPDAHSPGSISPSSPKPKPRPRPALQKHKTMSKETINEDAIQTKHVPLEEAEVQFDWMEHEKDAHIASIPSEEQSLNKKKFTMIERPKSTLIHDGLFIELGEVPDDDEFQLTKTPFFDNSRKVQIKHDYIKMEEVHDVESVIGFSLLDEYVKAVEAPQQTDDTAPKDKQPNVVRRKESLTSGNDRIQSWNSYLGGVDRVRKTSKHGVYDINAIDFDLKRLSKERENQAEPKETSENGHTQDTINEDDVVIISDGPKEQQDTPCKKVESKSIKVKKRPRLSVELNDTGDLSGRFRKSIHEAEKPNTNNDAKDLPIHEADILNTNNSETQHSHDLPAWMDDASNDQNQCHHDGTVSSVLRTEMTESTPEDVTVATESYLETVQDHCEHTKKTVESYKAVAATTTASTTVTYEITTIKQAHCDHHDCPPSTSQFSEENCMDQLQAFQQMNRHMAEVETVNEEITDDEVCRKQSDVDDFAHQLMAFTQINSAIEDSISEGETERDECSHVIHESEIQGVEETQTHNALPMESMETNVDTMNSHDDETPLYIVSKDVCKINVSTSSKMIETTQSAETTRNMSPTMRITTPTQAESHNQSLTQEIPPDSMRGETSTKPIMRVSSPPIARKKINISARQKVLDDSIHAHEAPDCYAAITTEYSDDITISDTSVRHGGETMATTEAVTLEIQGNKLVEQGENQMYRDASSNRPSVQVTLTSVKMKQPQNVTAFEMRSAGIIPRQKIEIKY